METDDLAAVTDEDVQLGALGRALEKGWLAGIGLGFLAVVVVAHRRARNRTRRLRSE
jgi:hypothetical protein